MRVFVDSSAFYAAVDTRDVNHNRARLCLQDLAGQTAEMVCTNYILLETIALLQHRLGVEAVRAFQADVVPVLRILWIDREFHDASLNALLVTARRRLSLVDCTSFEAMRRERVTTVFAFDPHFAEQGFDCIPRADQGQPG